MTTLLLDTCALLWFARGEGLSSDARVRIIETLAAGRPIYVSPITAWEIGLLVSRGRLPFREAPDDWFKEMVGEWFALAPLTPAILIDSHFLPQSVLRDPADKIIAATARALSAPLMTRDRPLLAYAEAGWMQAVAC